VVPPGPPGVDVVALATVVVSPPLAVVVVSLGIVELTRSCSSSTLTS
jgi:hypothetical protein